MERSKQIMSKDAHATSKIMYGWNKRLMFHRSSRVSRLRSGIRTPPQYLFTQRHGDHSAA